MSASKARHTRKARHQRKQAQKFGKRAKPTHKSPSGRTGSVKAKHMRAK